jgi:predicted lipoprotein with Yx(FWY)xxD motif
MSTFRVGRLGLGAGGAVVAAALLAACASGSSSGTSSGTPAGGSSGLKTRATSIGTVLVDGSGRTVYELVGDSSAKRTCTGPCLAIWPAVKVNGRQVVVNGHPAYTYVGDRSAGQTAGQNLRDRWGLWLALDAGGNPIGAGAGSGSSTPASSSSSKAGPGGAGPAF